MLLAAEERARLVQGTLASRWDVEKVGLFRSLQPSDSKGQRIVMTAISVHSEIFKKEAAVGLAVYSKHGLPKAAGAGTVELLRKMFPLMRRRGELAVHCLNSSLGEWDNPNTQGRLGIVYMVVETSLPPKKKSPHHNDHTQSSSNHTPSTSHRRFQSRDQAEGWTGVFDTEY